MKRLVIGNWKMNPQTVKEAVLLFKNISAATKNTKNVDIVICSPLPFISSIKQLKNKKIKLGAQNVFFEKNGAYTGEVSAQMLHDIGVEYVIIGHSERRSMGETNEVINKKLIASIKAGLTPILCVGESTRGTHDGFYLATVREQLDLCLANISKNQIKDVVVAYEPVWALSSTLDRHDSTPHDFEEMKIYIRKILTDIFGQTTALAVRIIYGGSANKDNAESYLSIGADGLLPGKASLDYKNFAKIVDIASSIK